MSLPEEIKVHMEIMTCNGCGAHAINLVQSWAENPKRTKSNGQIDWKEPIILASAGYRITNHKCAGAWTIVGKPLAVAFSQRDLEMAIDAEEVREELREKLMPTSTTEKRGA